MTSTPAKPAEGSPIDAPNCKRCHVVYDALSNILDHAERATEKGASKTTKHDCYYAIMSEAHRVMKTDGIIPKPTPPRKITDCWCGKHGDTLDFIGETGPEAYLVLCKKHRAEAKAFFVDGIEPTKPVSDDEDEEAPVAAPAARVERSLEAFA